MMRSPATKPYIIGLSGKIHSGKSTVANTIAAKHQGMIVRGFADALKQDVCGMGFDRETVYSLKPPWMRALLQAYGQAKRALDEDYWVKRLDSSIKLCKPGTVFIIDDMRFPNEVYWVKTMGGVTIRLEREGYPIQSDDYSETAIDHAAFDHTVHGVSNELDDLVEHVLDCLWYEGQR